jgi:hypothetical protein
MGFEYRKDIAFIAQGYLILKKSKKAKGKKQTFQPALVEELV